MGGDCIEVVLGDGLGSLELRQLPVVMLCIVELLKSFLFLLTGALLTHEWEFNLLMGCVPSICSN